MAVFVWVMMGLALWHFTVFLPDRFYGGIVGAFLGALIGSVVVGLLANGLSVPSRDDTDLAQALIAVPGALLGMGVMYAEGIRRGVEPLEF
jgi:hypothetical protein